MNFSRFRALLQRPTTVSAVDFLKLWKPSIEAFERSNRISFPSARTYCSCTTSAPSEEKFEPDNHSEEFNTSNRPPIDYRTITGNDPKKLEKLKQILQELDNLTLRGERMPKVELIRVKYWQNLLSMESKQALRRYLYRLRSYQDGSEKRILEKKEKVKQRHLERKSKNFSMRYGLMNNTIFYRIHPKQVFNLYNWKLIETSAYGGNDLIIDCSYEEFMTVSEVALSSKQLVGVWSRNRDKLKPFNLTYCNLNPNGRMAEELTKMLPLVNEPGFPFTRTESSYTELFPKERLVYLTPHGDELMEKFDPNSIYIMGASCLLAHRNRIFRK